jgi:hypothetical protein
MDGKPSRLCRVVFEVLEDGVVVSGRTQSATKWVHAYINSLEDWQDEPILARILIRKMEVIFDDCEIPSDIDEHNDFLEAAWTILASVRISLVTDAEIEELRKNEFDIRSGKAFEETLPPTDPQTP